MVVTIFLLMYMSSISLPFAVPIQEFSTFLLRKRDISSWHPFSFQDAKKLSYVLFCSVVDLRHFVISWRRRKDEGKKTQNCVFFTSPRNNEIASFRLRLEITKRRKFLRPGPHGGGGTELKVGYI